MNQEINSFYDFKVLTHLCDMRGGQSCIAQNKLSGEFVYLWLSENVENHMREGSSSVAAQILNLNHENLVNVKQCKTLQDGSVIMVMDYLKGTLLSDVIKSVGKIDQSIIAVWVERLASAIDYAHSQGIFHGEIRPDQIIIMENGDVKLLNIGVSQLLPCDIPSFIVAKPRKDYVIYFAPEMIESGCSQKSCDSYALAVIVFEMLYGTSPYNGSDIVVLTNNILTAPPNLISKEGIVNSEKIEPIFLKALDKDVSKRFSSAVEFALELKKTFLGDAAETLVQEKEREEDFLEVDEKREVSLSDDVEVSNEIFTKKETNSQPMADPKESVRESSKSPPPPREFPKVTLAPEAMERLGISFGKISFRRIFIVVGLIVVISCGIFLYDVGEEERSHANSIRAYLVSSFEKENDSPKIKPRKKVSSDKIQQVTDQQIADKSKIQEKFLSSLLMGVDLGRLEQMSLMNRVSKKARNISILPYLKPYIASEYAEVRAALAKALQRSKLVRENKGFELALALLDDPDYLVRGFAIKAVASSGRGASLQKLKELRKIESNEVVIKVLEKSIESLK